MYKVNFLLAIVVGMILMLTMMMIMFMIIMKMTDMMFLFWGLSNVHSS